METATKLKINQHVFAIILLLVAIVSAYLFYQQEQLRRQSLLWQTQFITLQDTVQQWQEKPLNNELSTVNAVRILILEADVALRNQQEPAKILNLLEAAQQQLKNFTDPNLQPLQQALQTDIATLQQLPKINIAAISEQISFLMDKVSQLKFFELKPSENQAKPVPAAGYWQKLQRLFGHVIDIQHINTTSTMLLSSNQQLAVQLYLRSTLLQCWWAMQQHNNQLYQASLAAIKSTLEQFTSNGSKIFQPALTQLQAINITVHWPTHLAAMQALQSLAKVTPNKIVINEKPS